MDPGALCYISRVLFLICLHAFHALFSSSVSLRTSSSCAALSLVTSSSASASSRIRSASRAQTSKSVLDIFPLLTRVKYKMDASAFEVADIYETSVCPLARVMRRELKRRGIKKLKVVYSKEPPITPLDDMSISCRTHCICPPGTARKCTQRRQVPGSSAFVPASAGLIIAGEVVKDLIEWEGTP